MTAGTRASIPAAGKRTPGYLVRPVAMEPAEAAARLRVLDGFVWLDSSAGAERMGRYSYMAACPRVTLRAEGERLAIAPRNGSAREVRSNPWDALARWGQPRRTAATPGLPPFRGGLIGYLGYDLGRHLEAVPATIPLEPGPPDMVFGVYGWVLAFDHLSGEAWLTAWQGESESAAAEAELDYVEALLSAPARPAGAFGLTQAPVSRTPRDEYCAAVERALDYIRAGDIYQVNLSHRLESEWHGDPFALFSGLRHGAPVPYGAYLDFGETKLLSASPERFLRLEGGYVETRPIKGTRPRGAGAKSDREMAAELLTSEKDRAENLMIVDLLRNDLGRVCRIGTVSVPEMFALEGFSNVWHLVSTVTGILRAGLGPVDLLRACFPGGSVTGCPKIRAMQVIEELEPVRRGPYCGAIFAMGHDGFMESSITIRTIVLHGERLWLQAGGAIVADSEPAAEHDETMAKAASALAAIAGVSG